MSLGTMLTVPVLVFRPLGLTSHVQVAVDAGGEEMQGKVVILGIT